MRQIAIDIDVFAAIWSRRLGHEHDENQILRRLLNLSAKTSNVGPVEASDPLSVPHQEVKRSNEEGVVTGKIRWVDDIKTALGVLGGHASLHSIYREVEKRRR